LLSWNALESLQREINDEFRDLELPYYIRIDDYNIFTRTFEYTLELRYTFLSGVDTKEKADEIAKKLLANWITEGH
jgi:hypothetical protein